MSKEVTVEEMIELLKKVPGHYIVSYDNAMGYVEKSDFTVYDDEERVSING